MTDFEKLLLKFNAPTTCRFCGEKLILNEKFTKLSCQNMNCSSRIVSRLSRWTNKALTWAPKTITKLLDAGLITTISSLYEIDYSKVAQLDGMGERSAEKLQANLKKATSEMTLAKFIAGYNIEDIGETILSSIIEQKKIFSFEDLTKLSVNEIVCKGVGETTAKKLYDGLNALKDDMLKTLKYIAILEPEKPITEGSLNGMSFCFTGKACMPRSKLEAIVKENGGTISPVKEGLSYLITDDTESGSSKNKKAKELGIKVMTSEDFLKLVKVNY